MYGLMILIIWHWDFTLHLLVQNGSVPHPALYSVGTEGPIPTGKVEHEAYEMCWVYLINIYIQTLQIIFFPKCFIW